MSISINWVGGFSGIWSDENSWDPPMVPSGNNIIVNFPGKFSGVYIIVIDQDVTINSMYVSGGHTSFTIASPFSLTITDTLFFSTDDDSNESIFYGLVQIADGVTISGDGQSNVGFSLLSSIAGVSNTATYTAQNMNSLNITSLQLCGSLSVTNVDTKQIPQSTAIVCGASCCTISQTCVNGACCASESVCGSNCCVSGETCSNGACANPNPSSNCGKYTCSAGESCCDDTTCCLATQTCCGKYCCYPNEACCNGICCNPGQACNVDNICANE